jgi:hypothetical protein
VVRGWLLVSATRTYENVLPDGSDGRVPAASLLGNLAREKHALLFDVLISEPQVSIGKLLMR